MAKHVTKSALETKKIAKNLAKQLQGGEVLGLVGELGAGKTTFVQGLAEYFGVKEHASSPTFTLINEYIINQKLFKNLKFKIIKLVHIDCYRLESNQELLDIGFSDYLNRDDAVVIIEWAEKVREILPKSTQWIYFEHGDKEDERVIKQRAHN